ncbi:hypothetical protein KDA_56370 [Dictyobacter alpinus]|uniref:UspA domain-containing protein n=1 Tax=Dictyobacter alpinus TaxID=2014873 RepID=A0A402BFJ0_9CHLR|nr:universal stress protein [Dictyobacter alpinus]GCE30153.1 hypothetical protein KDA_56370 [Dictyobacter alpinus]
MPIHEFSREQPLPINVPYNVKHILVPLNGTACSEEALSLAARIARNGGARITLLRVVKPARDYDRYPLNIANIEQEPCKQDIEDAQAYLRNIIAKVSLGDIDIQSEILAECSVSALVHYAQVHNVDLIVMCSHGYTGLTRWIRGSVAQQLFRQCPIPVLVLRQDAPFSLRAYQEQPHVFRMLVVLDGSAIAEAVIPPAIRISASLSTPMQGHLHLLRVVQPVYFVDEQATGMVQRMNDEHVKEAWLYLKQLQHQICRKQLDHIQVDVSASVALESELAYTIIRVAEEGETENGQRISEGYDSIAISTQGHSGLPRWVSGSIAEQLLGKTRLPLLVIPHPHKFSKDPMHKAIPTSEGENAGPGSNVSPDHVNLSPAGPSHGCP